MEVGGVEQKEEKSGCPGVVYETWRADEVILERKKSSQSRDCHDLSHTCARVACAHK